MFGSSFTIGTAPGATPGLILPSLVLPSLVLPSLSLGGRNTSGGGGNTFVQNPGNDSDVSGSSGNYQVFGTSGSGPSSLVAGPLFGSRDYLLTEDERLLKHLFEPSRPDEDQDEFSASQSFEPNYSVIALIGAFALGYLLAK